MNTVEIIALAKVAVYILPLLLLLQGARWKWLTLCLIVLIVANVATAAGTSRIVGQYIGLAFQAFLILHVLDLSKYVKRPAGS